MIFEILIMQIFCLSWLFKALICLIIIDRHFQPFFSAPFFKIVGAFIHSANFSYVSTCF